MKRFGQFIGIVLILVVVASLGIYAFTPQEKLLRYVAPQIKVVRISNLQIKKEQATMQLHLQATSPWLPVYISKLQYYFKIFDQSVARGSQSFTNAQNGKVQPINLSIRANYPQILPLLQRQLADSTPVNASFNLTCRVPLAGIQTIATQATLPIEIPIIIVPEITSLATEEIGFQHMQVVLTLQVSNPNKYDYYLRNLSVSAQFPGYKAVADNIPANYLIKTNQVTPIKITSAKAIEKLDKNNLFRANNTLAYQLNTTLILEPVGVPIDKINFQATRSGSVTVPPGI
ncbi:hypothetical protein HUW51_23845 [Adhaeribacter swui]|uniref:LEA type 2 family protein n=1 Tax=Adhaeribacter swui TaxID=2086471 RepID=A0A7G7GEK7_9BACT|nr:hypothetical protein [Adhaeribacter swui]QNF35591.1 hypothetical protein HUW51_23845 [Adhaeribacter swui]